MSRYIPKIKHWEIYLPTVLASLLLMVLAIMVAEKRKRFREVFLFGVFLLGLSFTALHFVGNFLGIVLSVLLFFLGFNTLGALIPFLLTKLTHKDLRGLSLGFFNTAQFLGAFLGGMWGGYTLKHGYSCMTFLAIGLAALWFFVDSLWFRSLRTFPIFTE